MHHSACPMMSPRYQNSLTVSNSSPTIVIHIGKASSAPATVEQVLQMKSLSFLKLYLIPEQSLCTHFLQLKQRIEFAPTPFQHTPHVNLTDVILVTKALCLEHMTFVFPMFTFSPLNSNPSFQFFSLIFNSSSDSATMKRSLAYNSSQVHTILNSCDRTSITMIKMSIQTKSLICSNKIGYSKTFCLVNESK